MQLGEDVINGLKQRGRKFSDADIRFKMVGIDVAHDSPDKVNASTLQRVDRKVGAKENGGCAFSTRTHLNMLVEKEKLRLTACF